MPLPLSRPKEPDSSDETQIGACAPVSYGFDARHVGETLRAYAIQRSAASGDRAATVTALARWYLARFPLAQRGNRGWLTALAPEIESMGVLVQSPELDPESAHSLARLRVEPLIVTGDLLTAVDEVERALQVVPQLTTGKVRLVLLTAGLLGDVGRVEEAIRRCDEGEALIDSVGETDLWGSLRLLSPKPLLLARSADPTALVEAETLARAQVAAATTPHERADARFRLALVVSASGRDVTDLDREVAALAREVGDQVLAAISLKNLAEESLRHGALPQAAAHQLEALRYSTELGMQHITAFGLIAAARIAESLGHDADAVRLHAKAEMILAETGVQMYPEDEASNAAMLARATNHLGAARYNAERDAGARLKPEEALVGAESVLSAAMSPSEPVPKM